MPLSVLFFSYLVIYFIKRLLALHRITEVTENTRTHTQHGGHQTRDVLELLQINHGPN